MKNQTAFDRLMGRILDGLFGIGLFCVMIAAGYLWGSR